MKGDSSRKPESRTASSSRLPLLHNPQNSLSEHPTLLSLLFLMQVVDIRFGTWNVVETSCVSGRFASRDEQQCLLHECPINLVEQTEIVNKREIESFPLRLDVMVYMWVFVYIESRGALIFMYNFVPRSVFYLLFFFFFNHMDQVGMGFPQSC